MFGGWGFGGSNEDHGNAKELQNDPEFNKEMSSAGSKLVVVDFFAVWCGPCKMVAPQFAALSKKYTNVVFLKVDVDKLSGTAGTAGVRAMPTFQFYKNNSKIDEVVGGDMAAVEQKIQKHMTSASAFEGNAGRVLGRSSAQPGVNPYQQQASQQNQPIISEQDLYKALAGVGTTGQQNVQQNIQNTVQQTSQQQVPEQQATSSSDVAQVDNTPVEITDAQVQDEANKLEQSRPMIRLEANEDLLNELLAMEFPRTRAEKALILTSNQGVEQAIDWIMNHGEDMDIDEPITEQQRNVPAPETPEQREERYRQARQKALELQKHIRQKVADQEKKAELEREKKRRQMGKETGVMKEELAQMQRQKEIEEKKREKKREIEAKKAALDKIAAQKEARRLEALARKGIVPEEQQQQSQTVQQPVQQSAPQTEYTECQLQVRLFDGSTIRGTFKPTDTVKAVYDFVRTKQAGNFKLMTTFPRRIYDASTHNLTLKEADLMPRASLVLTQ